MALAGSPTPYARVGRLLVIRRLARLRSVGILVGLQCPSGLTRTSALCTTGSAVVLELRDGSR